jgi:adenine-specific DNA-methyltransferase
MSRKQRLELTWIGKDERPRLEPRILLEDTEKSFHAPYRVTDHDIFDNRLIFGDNLLALKALEQEFTGKIKCIFIDPPYNTGSAFEHYDDGVEHSIWLGLMRDRLEILRNLLAEDGSIWITIDDNEAHYLKVMCDELFGRKNFVANVVWQKKYAPANDALWLSDSHDHILVFAKNKSIWRPNKLARTSEQNKLYSNPDNDPRGAWMSDNYTCAKSFEERPNLYYAILNPNTNEEIWPKKTRVWAFEQSTHQEHIKEQKIYWGKDGRNNTPRLKKFLSDLRSKGRVSSTIWLYEEVGHTQDARREILAFNPDNPFSTPKPEKLIHQILELSTNPGDLVLDSFAGSGTTGAVAQKMGRRWIMIELGEHCHTHIIPRLQKVINNEDPGGITKTVNWQGGGGFRYYKLAPSLLEKDKYDNWIISPKYNAAMLAEAMCKLMGFTYFPSQTHYWNQGYSSESDHIYVTTNHLNYDQLNAINQELREDQSLLICCKAYHVDPDQFPKITIAKIPQAVLHQCEWGHDDYSLNVANLKTLEKPPQPIQIQQLSFLGDNEPKS